MIERDETNQRVPNGDPAAATDPEVTQWTLDAQRAAFVRLVDNGRGGFDLSLLITVTLGATVMALWAGSPFSARFDASTG